MNIGTAYNEMQIKEVLDKSLIFKTEEFCDDTCYLS